MQEHNALHIFVFSFPRIPRYNPNRRDILEL